MAIVGIPITLLTLFISVDVIIAIVGIILGLKKINGSPMIVVFAGIMMFTIIALSQQITMGYAETNQIINSNVTSIISNTTVYDVSQYYTTTNSYTGNNPFVGEYYNVSSTAIGKTFSCMTIPLKKVGVPTGVIYFGVLDTTNKGTMKKIIGSMDIGALTTGFKPITQCAGSVGLNSAFLGSGFDKYTIVTNDKIGIFYNDGNATNYLVTGNSRYKDFDTSGDPTCATHTFSVKVALSDVNAPPFYAWGSCFDMTMQLVNTNAISQTTNKYNNTLTPIPYAINQENIWVFLMLLGILWMLIGVIIQVRLL